MKQSGLGGAAAAFGDYGMRHRDVMFAAGIVGILSVLLLPLPTIALDLGLAMSLALSVLILMVSLWIGRPLEFSSFPTILLVVTMLRLALNVATTRAILSEGHKGTHAAGGVIQGFAEFIMGGNFVIGLVLFSILVLVNFIVITKGATRIAEVGARFSLDAMPGKQMAIDADLSAGVIDDAEARRRRKELEDESSFYGAMDGASKFVRGDAIAGLLITLINLIGGMIIGVLQYGMSAGDAATTFSMLTVGDGLVSQVPALLVSLAAGLIVTKGGNAGSAEQMVLSQLGGYPKALMVAAGLMLILAVTPGLPALPFILLAASFSLAGWQVPKAKARQEMEKNLLAAEESKPRTAEATVQEMLRFDEVRLDVGASLVPMIAGGQSDLAVKLRTLRGRFASEYGFVLPNIRIKDSASLPAEGYVLMVHAVETARGEIRPHARMALAPGGGSVDLPGEQTKDPSFGLPAVWIDPAYSDEAELAGYTVIPPESVIVTHVAEAVKENLPTLLTYAATQRLIDGLDGEHIKLAHDVVPGLLPMIVVQRVLQGLLAERVSIRNLPLILESLAEAASWTRSVPLLVEHVRARLSLQICHSLAGSDGFVPVIAVSPEWERILAEGVVGDGDDRRFALAPTRVHEFLTAARSKIQAHAADDPWPAIIVGADVRPFVRSIIERISPATAVISHAEIDRKARLKTVDQI